jgi:hypothetical protein
MDDNHTRGRRTRQSRSHAIGLALASIALLPAILLALITWAPALERDGWSVPWSRWATVNMPFGIAIAVMSLVAVAAVVTMYRLLARELHHRAEPAAQKECTDPTHTERFQSTEASLRTLHLELLKMSINDPDLSEVWPLFEPGLSWERNRQYQYANLIMQHMLLSLRLGHHDGSQIENSLRYLFTSQLMRDFWLASRRARMTLAPGTQEFEFSSLIDEICAVYEDVLNSAGAER